MDMAQKHDSLVREVKGMEQSILQKQRDLYNCVKARVLSAREL